MLVEKLQACRTILNLPNFLTNDPTTTSPSKPAHTPTKMTFDISSRL